MKKLASLLFLAFVWQWLRYLSTRCQVCSQGRMVPLVGTMRRIDGATQKTICDCCSH